MDGSVRWVAFLRPGLPNDGAALAAVNTAARRVPPWPAGSVDAAARGALPKSGRAAHVLTAGLPRKAYRLRRRPRSPKAILASLLASATVTARLGAFSAARHLSALPEAPAPKVIQRYRRFARLRGRPPPSRRPRDSGAEVPGWSKLLPAGIVTAAQKTGRRTAPCLPLPDWSRSPLHDGNRPGLAAAGIKRHRAEIGAAGGPGRGPVLAAPSLAIGREATPRPSARARRCERCPFPDSTAIPRPSR